MRNYVHRIVSPISNFELKGVYFTVSIIFVVHDFPSFLIDKKNITSDSTWLVNLISFERLRDLFLTDQSGAGFS